MKELIKLTNRTSIYPADICANWLILSQREAGPLYTACKDITCPEIRDDEIAVARTEAYTSVLELTKHKLCETGRSLIVYQVDYQYCLGSIKNHRLRWLTDFEQGSNVYSQRAVCELTLDRKDQVQLRKTAISLHYFTLRVFDRASPIFSDSMRFPTGVYELEVIGLTSNPAEQVRVIEISSQPSRDIAA